MNAVQKLSTMYTEQKQSPSMLYSPTVGYTLSYPGNHDSRPVHPMLKGGATRAERGWAARMREQKNRGEIGDDDYDRLNNLVHSKTAQEELEGQAAFRGRVEQAKDKSSWGGATDGFRGKAAEARESRFLTPDYYNYLSDAVHEKFMTGKTEYPMTNQEWKEVHKRPKHKDWNQPLPKYP